MVVRTVKGGRAYQSDRFGGDKEGRLKEREERWKEITMKKNEPMFRGGGHRSREGVSLVNVERNVRFRHNLPHAGKNHSKKRLLNSIIRS